MSRRKKPPELTFQKHIADFLIREHGYGLLEQADITDDEHYVAEDQLWAFLNATQTIGLIDRVPVHPREVFADALADRASAVIVAHNHPSGGIEPSA